MNYETIGTLEKPARHLLSLGVSNKLGKPIVIIPGNSYGAMVYHVVLVTQDFAKYRPGCMNGIAALVNPNSNSVQRVKIH